MDSRIEQWISEMTLEEKAAFCSGEDVWHTKGLERQGIPKTMLSDGPHGLRKQEEQADNLGLCGSIKSVCFPAACAGAASFDVQLIEKLGDLLGEECREQEISILLGPAVNMKRSPLCGRNFEYFSEDPYLAGKLAAAYIKGVQKHNVGTSIKHFAANNQESSRQTVSAQVSGRALREIYLKAFEIAVKEAKPWTVMCSYNRINGVYASENKKLLTDILRKEWGFEGYVMSDWGAVNDRVLGLEAGLDLEMPGPGGGNDQKIVGAVKAGRLKEEVLNRSVARILETVLRSGKNTVQKAQTGLEGHHREAVNMAAECAVLLKNEGLLPLEKRKKIVYIGYFAARPRYQGGGSSHINAYQVVSALEAAEKEGFSVTYCQGFSEEDGEPCENLFSEAVKAAETADCAVIFAGLPEKYESEGYDRTHMRLPLQQNRLIEAVCGVQSQTAVVLHNGSPVEMPWIDRAAAVLELYLAGEGAGEAAHQLLYGDKNPCGRLPETFPLKLEDNPSYLNFPGRNRKVEYAEDIYIGYRYYERKKMQVLFPFGHGLSYTTFAYKNLRASMKTMGRHDTVKVSVDVENTGHCFGKEIVQLYLTDRTGAADRPEKELIGFAKLELQPGECRTAEFFVDFRSLAWYSEELGEWHAAKGAYVLSAARSSAEISEELTLWYETDRTVPFVADRFTTVGELLAQQRTQAFIQNILQRLAKALNPAGLSSMPPETVRRMAENLPLSAIQGFMKMPDEEFESLLEECRSLLREEGTGV